MYADSVCECAEFRSAIIAQWELSTERNYEKFHTLMQLGAMSLKNDSVWCKNMQHYHSGVVVITDKYIKGRNRNTTKSGNHNLTSNQLISVALVYINE